MRELPESRYLMASQSAFTLLEMLVVLVITGVMLSIAAYGVLKFRTVMIVSNTAKEIVLQLRQARRYSINNVVTSTGQTPEGYYIYFDGSEMYYWGECRSGVCSHTREIKSAQYTGVRVTHCTVAGGPSYSVIKFNAVTGEFVITNNAGDNMPTPGTTCIIEVGGGGGLITTTRRIEVSGASRTIKML